VNPHARFLAVLLVLCGSVLAVILALNLLLGERALGSPEVTRMASEWQQRSKGVTYAPPTTHTRAFKILRLADRLPEINGVVLGSSTLMGITEGLFPPPLRVYNFSLTANPTAAITAEAEYLARRHGDRVRWMLIGLDWPIGMIYYDFKVPDFDLSRDNAGAHAAPRDVALHRRLADALSYPRVVNLAKALRHVATAADPVANFRGTFLDIAGPEYRCAEGVPARDFDVVNRGLCLGFRYDGSWTFGGEKRLTTQRSAVLARAAAAPSSKFSRFLCQSRGEPNREYLERLAAVAQRQAGAGGRALFYLPPLIPGMERYMMEVPQSKACLDRTRDVLDGWARASGVTVIDAGQSERYGCLPAEFLDEHHAYPECHARVFERFRRDEAAGRVSSGIYRPEVAQ
jgi:hypothetical protein